MKNFEHYEEQIRECVEKEKNINMECDLHDLMIGKPNECSWECGKCFIETFHWLNEEYQEPKVILPKKLATILSGLDRANAFEIVHCMLEDTYKLRFLKDGNCLSFINYNPDLFDIGNLKCGEIYYLKDCDFTKGEE